MYCHLLLAQPSALGTFQSRPWRKKLLLGQSRGKLENWLCLKQGNMSYTSGPSTRPWQPWKGERKLPGLPLPPLPCQNWPVLWPGHSRSLWEKQHHFLCSFTSLSSSLSAKRNSLGCFVDGVIYSPSAYCLWLYGYLLCSKNKQQKITNPGAPVPSRKINREFSLLCFQVREERTIFITTDSPLPWGRKVFLYI